MLKDLLDRHTAIVEIVFALGIIFALIQAGFAKEAAIVTPIITGIFGYMKGVADGKKTGASPTTKGEANEKIIPDPTIDPGV